MNFSDTIKISNALAPASPNCLYLACASQHKVVVRLADTLQVCQVYSCVDIIYDLTWSPDSLFILCVLKKRGIVQVLSLENPDWVCKVDEGSCGLLGAIWAPDSRHFLTTADFFLRITIWSLSEVSVSYLKLPKACTNNLAFSPGGRYLALIERRNFQDHLSLFDCQSQWRLLYNYKMDTNDAVGLSWSPDGRYIAIWDDCLYYKLITYNLSNKQFHNFNAYKADQLILGIKSVCWSPTGQLLAVGSYDQKCRILNHYNWTCLACLIHPVDKPINPLLGLYPSGRTLTLLENTTTNDDNNVAENNATGCVQLEEKCTYRPHRIDVYEEYHCDTGMSSSASSSPRLFDSKKHGHGSALNGTVQYRLVGEPITIRSNKSNLNQPYPELGIGLIAFSPDSRYLATRNDNCPGVIWIWAIDRRLSLFSLLIHQSGPVTGLMWDTTCSARLALCTGTDTLFLWTPQGCLTVQIPSQFSFTINSLNWLSSGSGIQLFSDTEFCLCYLNAMNRDNAKYINDDDAVESTDNAKSMTNNNNNNNISHLDKDKPIWQPPHLKLNNRLQALDDSLPIGDFGVKLQSVNDETLESITVGDTPNWLRQRTTGHITVDKPKISIDPTHQVKQQFTVTSSLTNRRMWSKGASTIKSEQKLSKPSKRTKCT